MERAKGLTNLKSRNESGTRGERPPNRGLAPSPARNLSFARCEANFHLYNPKDDDLNTKRAKPIEKWVEVRRRANVQIAGFICVKGRNTHRII